MSQRFPGCLMWSGLLLFAACGDSVSNDENDRVSEISQQNATWKSLGGNLDSEPADFVGKLSLAGDPRASAVLAFSLSDPVTYADKTLVSHFDGGNWVALGSPIAEAGPSIAVDSQRHILVCTGSDGPFVKRWNGSSYIALGGNIGVETGYKGFRYQVSSCGGIVVDSSDTPIITWSADVGAKADIVYAARFNAAQGKWQGLGDDGIGNRATDAYLDIDAQDRPYVATYAPGGSYGGGATTRIWRWNGNAWQQLGGDMPNTSNPVLAVYDNAAYLALHDNSSDALNVLRWRQNTWNPLPSLSDADQPAIDFTLSGAPIIAYIDSASSLRVRTFTNGAWSAVGSSLADETDKQVYYLDLSIDASGRPNVGWSDTDVNGNSSVFVKRYSTALP